MTDLDEEIRSVVAQLSVEKDYDYGYGGELVKVYRVDEAEAAGLIGAFVGPILARAVDAECDRDLFDQERLDAVLKLKAINTFLIDFGTFGQNDQAIWEYLNHGTPLPVKGEGNG